MSDNTEKKQFGQDKSAQRAALRQTVATLIKAGGNKMTQREMADLLLKICRYLGLAD